MPMDVLAVIVSFANSFVNFEKRSRERNEDKQRAVPRRVVRKENQILPRKEVVFSVVSRVVVRNQTHRDVTFVTSSIVRIPNTKRLKHSIEK
jgi:hypothetical protein